MTAIAPIGIQPPTVPNPNPDPLEGQNVAIQNIFTRCISSSHSPEDFLACGGLISGLSLTAGMATLISAAPYSIPIGLSLSWGAVLAAVSTSIIFCIASSGSNS